MDGSENTATQQDIDTATRPLDIIELPPATPLSEIDLHAHRPWALGPCIRPGDCVYFVGRAGSGKTYLVADILVSILLPNAADATCLAGAWKINREYLGLEPETKVAVINAETSGPDDWAQMILDTLAQQGYAPDHSISRSVMRRIHFWDATDLPLEQETLRDDAEALARAFVYHGYKIIVIDPVYDAFKPTDNGDATWVFRGLSPFVKILKRAGVLSLMIAHPSAAARTYGTKGGSNMEQAFAPHGTEKQAGVVDALFGIERPPETNTIKVIKLKSRRAGSWILNRHSFTLTFGSDGGYDSHDCKGWAYENPKQVTMPREYLKILMDLPAAQQFWLDPVNDGKPFRFKDFRKARELFFEPQKLLETVEVGSRKEYRWTDTGRQVRDNALKDARKAAKKGAKS